ncbi:MAG: MFS transporter, partial [Gemmatimonadaceae bacterium]
IRNVFWLASIPAAIAVAVLIFVVREVPRGDAGEKAAEGSGNEVSATLSRRFWGYLVVVLLFTLGNSTDAFLLLRAHQLGVPIVLAPILWALLNLVKAATGTYGGHLSDTLGRKPLIVGGWILYAAVYFAFGLSTAAWQAWVLFAVYGIFHGMTEGTEKALVADLVPRSRRGAAFGWYNLSIGLGALPASLIFGAIWDRSGAPSAFAFGATLALAAAFLMMVVAPGRPRRSELIS